MRFIGSKGKSSAADIQTLHVLTFTEEFSMSQGKGNVETNGVDKREIWRFEMEERSTQVKEFNSPRGKQRSNDGENRGQRKL